MLFEVSRTTGGVPPCKEAKEHSHPFKTRSDGRDALDTFWVVEFRTLGGFMRFLKKHRLVVVSNAPPKDCYHPGGSDHPGIEIYDDYRE